MAIYTTLRRIQKLVKGQLNAQDTINNALDALDKCMPYIVASVEIDAKTTGSTLLYTVPTGKTFVPVMTVIRPYALSSPTGTPTISVGTNSTSYDNLVSATSLDLDTAGDYAVKLHADTTMTKKTGVASATTIYSNVSVAGTGTTYRVKADLIGYLI